MELNLELTPEDGGLECVGLSSPLGGKHQRDLSLSAKWANNKALALEYLKRQREAILWIESVLERKLPRDLFEALKSGIVLRELLAKLYPEPSTQCLSPISRRYSLTMAPWKERENITIFLKHCKSMGMNDTFLFCTDDLYEGTNMVQVLFSIQHFMAFSREKSRYLFKPIVEESVTFSNQELEMALSKIEQAGVDVNAFLNSAPPSANPSPAKPRGDEAGVSGDDTPSTASSEPDSDAVEAKEEQDPAQDDADGVENEHEGENGKGDENDDEVLSDGDLEDAGEGEEEEAAALQVLELELISSENNNSFDNAEDSYAEQSTSATDTRENIDDDEEPDLDAEGQLPDLETDDEDIAALQQLVDEEDEAEIFAFAATELDESIFLLEIMDEILNRIENNIFKGVGITEEQQLAEESQSVELIMPGDIEVVRLSSHVVTETTDKHDTYVGDSLAPTVVDTHATAETETPTNKFSRAARASKKASKAGKKQPESSNEPLDEEAMSKCTCGSKCTIM